MTGSRCGRQSIESGSGCMPAEEPEINYDWPVEQLTSRAE